MALNTANKRSSATLFLMPGYAKGSLPTGDVGQGTRQDASWLYLGILAGAAAVRPKVTILTDRYTAIGLIN